MITSLDVIEGSTSAGSSSGEEDSSSKFDTSAEDEADWVASGPPGAAAAGLTPPASPPPSSRHAKAAAQYHQLNPQAVADADFAAQYRITPAASGGEPAAASSCPPPPDSTKLVSASPSVSSVDVDAPVGHPGKAVYEVQGGSMTPLDPIRVEEGLHLPAKGTAGTGREGKGSNRAGGKRDWGSSRSCDSCTLYFIGTKNYWLYALALCTLRWV